MSRPLPAPQPDLSSRLLAAVAERDQSLAARLGQQWVHRRGLDTLERFLLTVLAPSQGLEAAQWLRAELGLVAVAAPAAPTPAPPLLRARLSNLDAPATPAPVPASLAALRSWLPDAEDDGRDLPRAC